MPKLLKYICLYLILLLASMVQGINPAAAYSAKPSEKHPFGLSFDDETPVSVDKNVARLEFLFEIPKDYYLYSKSIQVKLTDATIPFEIIKPNGEVKYDQFMEEEAEIFYGLLPVEVKLTLTGKNIKSVAGKISYQGCSGKVCFRVFSDDFEFKLSSSGASLDINNSAQTMLPEKGQGIGELLAVRDFTAVLEHGWLMAVIVTFLAGVITGFTPCVLPVIPLTLTFIGVSNKENKITRLKHLLVFVCGLVAMYASLGVASAALGKTFGFVFQSQIFVGFIAVVFVLMGLWSLGVVHWQTPLGLQQCIIRYQPQGYTRYFYAGLTIGFLATPCVGPILGPLLLYIATTKKMVLGLGYMTAYALGLSVLFFVLGFVSQFGVSRWSRLGHFFKKILGVLMLVTAAYYASVFILPARTQLNDFFVKDFETALIQSQAQNKKIIVDFYADWCLPCLEWDQKTWSNAAVQKNIGQSFVPVKIDCTTETPQCKNLIDRYQVMGWPTILFLNADGSEVVATRLVGVVMGADEFLHYSKSVLK